jgi:NADH-quinone oxidoreductase subunit L
VTAAAWVCLFSPLAAAVLITLGGTLFPRRFTGYIATASIAVAFVAAVVDFFAVLGRGDSDQQQISTAWTWLEAGNFNVGLSILVDPLSVLMMLIVTGVGMLIVGYSIGYMNEDDEERRYFAYMALFVFSMLLLVQGGNLLMLLIG